MGSDPDSYGVSIWQLPSPTTTPESTTKIRRKEIQTPRLQNSVQLAEPFRTPIIGGSSQSTLTPQSATSSLSFQHTSTAKTSLSPHDPQFHFNFQSASSLPLPPVDPSRRLSSSPHIAQQAGNQRKGLEIMDGFPLQTPPRMLNPSDQNRNQMQMPVQNAPMTASQGPSLTPVRSGQTDYQDPNFQTPNFHTPLQNQSWQISPDTYHFTQGPASAPVVPPGRFFWNQSPLINHSFDTPMSDMGRPNGNTLPNVPTWPTLNPPTMPFHDHVVQSSPIVTSSPHPDTGFWGPEHMNHPPSTHSFVDDSSFVHATTGVNPNLIFSFSSPQTGSPLSGRGQQSSTQDVDNESRQPYEQQMRESHREKELTKKLKQQHNRNTSTFGNGNRPGLHRSNTDSGFRRTKTRSLERPGQSNDHVPRKPSPLKRLSQASLSSIPEGTKSSMHRTRLVVDDTGTARTETYNEGDAGSRSRRSFGVWVDDDDSSEEDPIINSQRNSFIMPSDFSRPTKQLRGDGDFEGFDLLERPLSSTSLSSASSNVASGLFRRSVSLNIKNRLSQGSFSDLERVDGYGHASSQETVTAEDEGGGDAQDALKRLIGGRIRRDVMDPNATIKPRRAATNPVPTNSMIDITKFPSPPSPLFSLTRPVSSINTPLTDRSNHSSESTRCLCGSVEEGSWPMIQCESCAKFSHIRCIFGSYAEEGTTELPRLFVCAFCTGQYRQRPAFNDLPKPDLSTNYNANPMGYRDGHYI